MTVSEKPLRLPMVMKAGRIAAELGLGPAIRSLPLSPAMSRRYQELASAESHKPRCGLQHTELGGAVPERKGVIIPKVRARATADRSYLLTRLVQVALYRAGTEAQTRRYGDIAAPLGGALKHQLLPVCQRGHLCVVSQ